MHQPRPIPNSAPDMPALYFERTTVEERQRHLEKLAHLQEGDILIDAVELPDGGTEFEIVTMDWDEPGLLDKIFEAILRCHNLERGLSIRRGRIFTAPSGEVVNMLEMRDRTGNPLRPENREVALRALREIREGERGALETIQNFPFSSLIPLVDEIPVIDNEVSERYTLIRFEVERISNRFTSVLLNFLARSELWLNIQVAEFEQGDKGRFQFFVVDKHGRKLSDSSAMRRGLVQTLGRINAILTRFNLHYLRREWDERREKNQFTIYHSRPNLEDYLKDLESMRQVADLKGLQRHFSALVEAGLLESRSLYFLKKVEAFVNRHLERNRALRETGPQEGDVEFYRQYFRYRREAQRILMPLFEALMTMPRRHRLLSPQGRLRALSRPMNCDGYALDDGDRIYLDGKVWLGEPSAVLDLFLLMARTGCRFRADTLEAIQACLEGWNEFYIAEHRAGLGQGFLKVLDESIRQGTTPFVLRNMRSVGLLERFIPGFEDIEGRIHVNADHTYTVDEHSLAVVQVLSGLHHLDEVLPKPGKSVMREDYETLTDAVSLKNYARKYAMELRLLGYVIPLRHHAAILPFFHVMDDVRRNRLEYLIEAGLLEFGYDTCMAALSEIEGFRRRLDGMVRFYRGLPFSERRVLALAGLLHDIRKPAVNHGELGADALADILAEMGLELPPEEAARCEWLIRHHLEIRPLMSRMGSDGERALAAFTEQAGDPSLVRSLILFTYADRVAMRTDLNANSHDAMVLSEMLAMVKD